MTPSRKQARSEGRDGFPAAWQWLSDLGVKPGGYQVETKARVAHAMKSRDWPEKQRVWACLTLATMGFNQELAVKLERGQTVPLTQSDISRQTGIAVNNVHRCVLDLESEGWLLRKPVDEERGLKRGEVLIHCYALPRPPKKRPEDQAEENDGSSEYDGLPDDLAYWLRHLKFHVPAGEKLDEARALCEKLTKARERLREICQPEPEQMPLPGVAVNPVKVARLAKRKGPRVVELDSARGGQKDSSHVRAAAGGVGARVPLNKEEIKEIKSTKEGGGRQAGSGDTKACLPADSLIYQIEQEILKTGICAKLKVKPDQALLVKIARKLRGNPPAELGSRIHLRFDDIKSLGIIEHLAEDVAEAWDSPKAARKETRSEMMARLDREIAEEERSGVD